MATDLWALDGPVLDTLIDLLEVRGEERVALRSNVPEEFGAETVPASLARLHRAGLIEGIALDRQTVIMVKAVTPSGLERAGAWPSPERWAEAIAVTLERAAERTEDPKHRKLLRDTGRLVGGAARDLVVAVAAGQLT